jgi:transmembrane sensor
MQSMDENYELAKWLNNEMTESELKAFQNSPHYETFVKIKTFSSELKTVDFDESTLLQKVLETKKPVSKVIPLYQSKWFKIAAVIILFFGLSVLYKTNTSENQLAANGKTTTFFLPDNSQVQLNSGSDINYKTWNWESNRNLNLNGEAYFKVAKGKKFTVTTSLGKVSVLGTQFNIRARKNRFEVTCYEGRVKVNTSKDEIILTKGNAVFIDNNSFSKENVSVNSPEWTMNEMVFKAETLTNVIEEINRKFDVSIVLKATPSQQLFTGTLPTKNIKTTLDVLCTSYHLKITKFVGRTILLEEK